MITLWLPGEATDVNLDAEIGTWLRRPHRRIDPPYVVGLEFHLPRPPADLGVADLRPLDELSSAVLAALHRGRVILDRRQVVEVRSAKTLADRGEVPCIRVSIANHNEPAWDLSE